jgi:type I restriction enzyme S subunit
MSNKTINNLVPALRFPEFTMNEAWESSTIGKVGTFHYGKSAPKWSLSSDAPTPCVRYGELYTKFDAIISKILSYTNIDPSNLRFSKGGEVLIPRVGEVAQDFAKNCCYLPFPNVAIGEMISVYETAEHPIFYTYYFRNLWKQFAKVVEGQNVKNLYYVNLEPIAIGKPSFLEQQKIADILSSLDDLLTAENQKLEALKAHKKGLMQTLFPAEGQTVPALRFDAFKDSGDWEEKKLGEVLMSHPEYGLNEAAVPFSENLPIYIRITDISEDGKFLGDQKVSVDKEVTEKDYLNEGDIVLARTGASVGKSYKYRREDGRLVFAGFLIRLKPNEHKILSELLFQFLSTNRYWKWVSFISQRSGQPGINSNEYSSLVIPLPQTIQEQQKIAETLSSTDTLITAQAARIAQLKKHKKGLMQGLFPNLNDQ